MDYYNKIKFLLETNIFKQAKRYHDTLKGGGYTHTTIRGADGIGLTGIINKGAVFPNRGLYGRGSYWLKGSPDLMYGDHGVLTPNKGSKTHIKYTQAGREAKKKKIRLDPYEYIEPTGTKVGRKDYVYGVNPADDKLKKYAMSKGFRVVTTPAMDAAHRAMRYGSPIDYKDLMKTHRANRKLARRLKRKVK